MIRVQCACGQSLSVPDEAAGKRVKCRKCGQLVSMLAPGPVPVVEELQPEPAVDSDYVGYGRPSNEDEAAAALSSMINRPGPPPQRRVLRPDYADVLKGANWLRVMAIFAIVNGVLALLMAALCFWLAFVEISTRPKDNAAKLFVSLAAVLFSYGGWCFSVAILLRMAASPAVAIRDLARNSFAR